MGENKGGVMPPNVINYIRGGRIVIVATVGADGKANSAPFSWVVAIDNRKLRLGANQGVATLENIRNNGSVSLTITGAELHYTIRGNAHVVKENLDDLPFPVAVVEVQVEDVKDDSTLGQPEAEGQRTRWNDRRRVLSDSTIVQALLNA